MSRRAQGTDTGIAEPPTTSRPADTRMGAGVVPTPGVQGALLAVLLLSAYSPIRLSAQDTIPTGYGTLRRDEITVRLVTPEVELQLLPLGEDVIRLLAPDTYESLHALLDSRREDLDAAAARMAGRDPTIVMVSFFGVVPQARFVPDEVNVTSRGRLYRPLEIVPLGPSWNALQLDARQQAVAIYLFDEGISFREALTVTYQGRSSDAWSRAVRVLERERARVTARARPAEP